MRKLIVSIGTILIVLASIVSLLAFARSCAVRAARGADASRPAVFTPPQSGAEPVAAGRKPAHAGRLIPLAKPVENATKAYLREAGMGQPVVPNGLPMSKLHHAAFDAHLLGIDPDFRLHVSDRLLGQHDGPMLEALKQLDKRLIRLPRRTTDQPSRDRLAARFDVFLASR